MHYHHYLLSLIVMITLVESLNETKEFNRSELFSADHLSKYHWGTYKPNLYFAMKEKRNTTDVFGLMWYNPTSNGYAEFGGVKKRMRHECKKEDKVNYYWEYHNGLDYGSQFINDEAQNNMRLNTQWLKSEYNETHQSWQVLLHGEALKKNPEKSTIGLVLYVALEDYDMKEKAFLKFEQQGLDYELKGMKGGKEQSLMRIKLEGRTQTSSLVNSQYQKYRKAYNQTWRVKEFVSNELQQSEEEYIKRNKTYSYLNFGQIAPTQQPNVIAIQLVLKTPFDILITYSTHLNQPSISLEQMKKMISSKQAEFNFKFDKVFPINPSLTEKKQMTKEALSGILGGIGYFYGPIESNSKERYEPEAIFTGTPCRSFFARGFLWDEGFHNIIISKWDIRLSIDILNSYLNTMDSNGWIPREQIRGEEAKSQVPPEFIKQNSKIANPPTLIFPINSFISYYKFFGETNADVDIKAFLKKAFGKLKKWYEWYRVTQTDSKGKKKYQWYGRDSSHNFPSGFDDLPRGMTMNEEENHLDLYIWMIELVKTLKELSGMFEIELYEHYHSIEELMNKEIQPLFYDKELRIYNDYLGPQFKRKKVPMYPRTVFPYLWRGDNQCGEEAKNPLGFKAECNPYSSSMCCSEFGWCGGSDVHCKCDKCTFYDKLENRKEYAKKENTFNPHLGYIQLFPIFFGTYKGDSKEFDQLLNYILDEKELLSNAGIRSLSKSDVLYHTGEDYWRGHVWINMNYLTLRGLYNHYSSIPKAKKAYDSIRERVVQAIYSTWKVDHFFYEQYTDTSTQGRKNFPFNGWTALVLNIVTEQYDK